MVQAATGGTAAVTRYLATDKRLRDQLGVFVDAVPKPLTPEPVLPLTPEPVLPLTPDPVLPLTPEPVLPLTADAGRRWWLYALIAAGVVLGVNAA